MGISRESFNHAATGLTRTEQDLMQASLKDSSEEGQIGFPQFRLYQYVIGTVGVLTEQKVNSVKQDGEQLVHDVADIRLRVVIQR